ncbi:MAG TPA: elongation factor P [Candidatus Moranbacteria bacterium]|nr:elongation factor P [Candidatus Moranbacteria bacterium]
MLSLNEIKTGKRIVVDGDPFTVIFDQHSKMGRAGAVLRTKLRNLRTGAILNKTFQGNDKVEAAEIQSKEAQYLYQDGEKFYFMDNEAYEQFELSGEIIGEGSGFLKEGALVSVLYFEGEAINIELPIKIDLEVTEAPPSIKGNTADGGSKQVTLETGVKVSVPLFIETGDIIRVNTQTGQYAERAGKK